LWEIGVWRLKRARRNNEQGICFTSSKEEHESHVLRCEETKIWRDKVLNERCRNTDAKIKLL
jgi:hypothetical protein